MAQARGSAALSGGRGCGGYKHGRGNSAATGSATGSTVSKVVEQYPAEIYGRPLKVIAVHLIITPEYLMHVTKHHPEVIVYALRLDRGLSSNEILATVPGTKWAEERGLTDKHYIVPGGGGLGEVINNSFV